MVKIQSFILLIALSLFLFGCAEKDQLAPQSLILSLSEADSTLKVVNHEVRNKPFMKSQQQGRYQAHLLADGDIILEQINFEKMDIPLGDRESKKIDFFVSLPWISEVQRIEIYQLDGRSGHYQLKTDNPLLDWEIPQDIRQHSQSDE
ncbi:hypothetical protein [Fodinibius sp. Rm-B-1B1-1]|uniref:hypothetical protein n=1 Tax=Fodinibius alkaliphilus TaxID=3140241 RepID=UPI00315B1608